MSELLNDPLNLQILESICSGDGVEVNISAFSKKFKRHRNTIKTQVDALFNNKILDKPIYPFLWLYKEFPLLVIDDRVSSKPIRIWKVEEEDSGREEDPT